MRHKPMLLRKITAGSLDSARTSIGIIGTHHGTGVTYTGLMLAFYMGEELGKKTAFIECNKHHDMSLIEEAYDWTSMDSNMFSFQNIICYKDVVPEQIPSIYGGDYDTLIFDFGTDFYGNINEFLRCNTKIVVAGKSEWDYIKLRNFYERTNHISGSNNWLYLIQQADVKTIQRLCHETGHKIMSIPATGEPIIPSRSINRFFGMIL